MQYPKEVTTITQRTHPELFKPGIIITNAPYRLAFYHVEILTSHNPLMIWHTNKQCPMINTLTKGGIIIERGHWNQATPTDDGTRLIEWIFEPFTVPAI